MRLNRLLLYGTLSVLIVTSVQKTEPGRKPTDKNVVALNSEGESEPAERKAKSTFADLAISAEDIELVEEHGVPPQPPPLTPGEEYMPEKAAAVTDEHVEATYQQALRFLERGRGHGVEAYAHLFGDRARWSIDEARKIFEELAENGSPDAQLGLAFMHATGLGMAKSNQAKALVYYMFSALGGNPLAQMAMGYRYYAGIAVPQNCENALSYYEKAAQKVADGFRFSTGLAIQRIRLTDEMEPSSTNTVTVPMDQNLIEYYRFLAEKGDVSA
ncbi:Sel1 repeat protein, partial [Cooperia oncophora]